MGSERFFMESEKRPEEEVEQEDVQERAGKAESGTVGTGFVAGMIFSVV